MGLDPGIHVPGPAPTEDVVAVWPDMVDSFALFCDAPWQWVGLGMAGAMRVGIDRLQLEASARLMGLENPRALFPDIRIMEEEAVKVWSAKRGR